jgi:hypothetical protein
MQPFVSLTLARHQLVLHTQTLFEHRHSKCLPEELTIAFRQPRLQLRKRDYGVSQIHIPARQRSQYVYSTGDRSGPKTSGFGRPTLGEYPDGPARRKSWRQDGCSRSRIERMPERSLAPSQSHNDSHVRPLNYVNERANFSHPNK